MKTFKSVRVVEGFRNKTINDVGKKNISSKVNLTWLTLDDGFISNLPDGSSPLAARETFDINGRNILIIASIYGGYKRGTITWDATVIVDGEVNKQEGVVS